MQILNKKYKILLFNWQDIKNPLGGGAEVHMHEIFRRIASLGHRVVLYSCSVPNLPEFEVIDGIEVYRIGKRDTFNFIVPSLYKKAVEKEDFDIVIDDINKIPFYTPLYVKEPLLAISHHFFGKSIYRETNVIAGTYVYLSEKLVNLVYNNTPFAVVSQSTLDEFKERGFNTKQFKVIYNALTLLDYPLKVAQKQIEPTFTYFGRLKKYKSVDHLFLAFAKLKERIPNAKLWTIGRGDFEPYLKELAIKLGIDNDVTFHGYVDDKLKLELLSASHLVVNTSMKEGWGITNLEANACGTPVISANVPGLKDSVSIGNSGYLYEYSNINELSNLLYNTIENQDDYNKLCHSSIAWANEFSWDNSAEQMLEYIEEIVRK